MDHRGPRVSATPCMYPCPQDCSFLSGTSEGHHSALLAVRRLTERWRLPVYSEKVVALVDENGSVNGCGRGLADVV